MQYGPPPFLLNDNELLPFEHACMLREEHYSHPENLDSWESIMPTLWRFEVRWSIFGLSPLLMQMLFYILKQNKMARPNDINIYIILQNKGIIYMERQLELCI